MDGVFSIIITTSASILKILSPAQTQSQKENSIGATVISIEMSVINAACLLGNQEEAGAVYSAGLAAAPHDERYDGKVN